MGTAIGAGYQNTMAITATNECSSGAGFTATAPNRGRQDWYLPSLSEGMALYENQGAVGGLEGLYWTSSQSNANWASYVGNTSNAKLTDQKSMDLNVRAIRAF